MDRIPEETKGKVKRKIAERTEAINPRAARWIILIIASILSTLLLTFGDPSIKETYKVGDIAKRTVRATETHEIKDVVETEVRRDAAARAVRSVYNSDIGMVREARRRMREAFASARVAEDSNAARTAFQGALEISDALAARAAAEKFSETSEAGTLVLLARLSDWHITGSGEFRAADRERGITVLLGDDSEDVQVETASVIGLEEVLFALQKQAAKGLPNSTPTERDLAAALAASVARPTLSYAPRETDARKKRARVIFEGGQPAA